MRIAVTVAAALLLLAGCATGPDWAVVKRQATDIHARCAAEQSEGSSLAVERCANPSIRSLYSAAGLRDMDVFDQYLADREAIAERRDRGLVTEMAAKAEVAAARARAGSVIQQRNAQRAAAFDDEPPYNPPATNYMPPPTAYQLPQAAMSPPMPPLTPLSNLGQMYAPPPPPPPTHYVPVTPGDPLNPGLSSSGWTTR
jgi:hypothetical protein